MATLQDQSDSAFRDPDSMSIQDQLAAEDRNLDDGGYPIPEFADGEGVDDTPPPELEDDGEGFNRDSSSIQYADDETNPGPQMGDVEPSNQTEPPRRYRETSDDIHAPVQADEPSQSGELSESLIRRAKVYGVSPEVARQQYKSDAELESALLRYDQELLQYQQQQMWQRQQQQQQPMQQQSSQQQQPQQPSQQPPAQEQPLEIEQYQFQHQDIYDDQYLEDLRGMSEHHQKLFQTQAQQLNALKNLVEQQHRYLQEQYNVQQQERQRQHVESFDKAIQDLGENWSDVFGRGHFSDHDPRSPEMFNRSKVFRTANDLIQAHQMQGRNMDLATALESALHITFPGRQGAGQSSHSSQPRDSRGRYTSYSARPTGRSAGKPVDNRESTLRKWDEKFGSGQFVDHEDGI